MAQPQKITGQLLQSFIKDYNNGLLLKDLEKKYNVTTGCVWATVKRHNLVPRGLGYGRRIQFTDKLKNDLIIRFKETRFIALTAKEFSLSEGVLQKYLREWLGDEIYESILEQGRFNISGKLTTPRGYVKVLLRPDSKFLCMADKNRYVSEHRYVMAQYLGRPLTDNEQVHHIDGDKTNNKLNNLQLRIGSHGSGVCYECAECGSRKLKPIEI